MKIAAETREEKYKQHLSAAPETLSPDHDPFFLSLPNKMSCSVFSVTLTCLLLLLMSVLLLPRHLSALFFYSRMVFSLLIPL